MTNPETNKPQTVSEVLREHLETQVMIETARSSAETKDLDDLNEMREDPVVNALEDEIMAKSSPEGRPPDRTTRRSEWRVASYFIPFFIFVPALLVAAFAGPIPGIVTLFFALVLVCAAAPVWGSGLLRASEHRQAHGEAEQLLRPH